jgi:ABC-type phosphate transport system substrate-binding protein
VKKSIRRALYITGTTAALTTLVAGTALASTFPPPADPPSGQTQSTSTYNFWGSDTLQDIFQAFTNGYSLDTPTGTDTYAPDFPTGDTIYSWDATNPSNGDLYDEVTPVADTPTTSDTFHRPDGSGDGRLALSAAWGTSQSWTDSGGNTNTLSADAAVRGQEISGSRSSSQPSYAYWTNNGNVGSSNNDLTFIPLATDAVGVAEAEIGTPASSVSNLTTAALEAIYNDAATDEGRAVGDIIPSGTDIDGVDNTTSFPEYIWSSSATSVSAVPVVATLPQESSGTRSFFLSALGISSTGYASDVAEETTSEENDYSEDLSSTNIANALSSLTLPSAYVAIAPFSGAQAIEQEHFLTSISTLPNPLPSYIFPTINGDSLTNGESGDEAGIATSDALQTAQAPVQSYEASVVGDFARYVYGVLPSNEEPDLFTWLETTLESTSVTSGSNVPATQVWTDFGFIPTGQSVTQDSSDWITTEWLNQTAPPIS